MDKQTYKDKIYTSLASAKGKASEPLIYIARTAVLSLLHKIKNGKLRILTQSYIYEFGSNGPINVEMKIISDSFWVRLFLLGDMGFAEAYMLGDVVVDDLSNVFKLFILNREHLNNARTYASSALSFISYLNSTRFGNTLSNAINNISAHYDISNEMFAAFLSKDMTYSCAIFKDISVPEALETAQLRKLDYIIRQAKIGPSDHVLEIGSGWGSFAIRAVQTTGCKVTSLTLSKEQQLLARERVAQAGLTERISIDLCDYRKCIPPPGGFDKIVSIEMIEAVGKEFLETYFSSVNRLLKEQDGIAVFQVISVCETRYERYSRDIDFIQKYIFPGSHCPALSAVVNAIVKGSKGQLTINRVENIGGHYGKTLRMWSDKFLANFDTQIAPALRKIRGDSFSSFDISVFKRTWEYYFAYCAAGFEENVINDEIITVARENTKVVWDGLPL